MFLLTWPVELVNAGKLPFQPPLLVTLFLGWGFIFAALIMTGLTGGRENVFFAFLILGVIIDLPRRSARGQ